MRTFFLISFLVAGFAVAQECLVPRPASAPKAGQVNVKFPNPDGGSRPCYGTAQASSIVEGAPRERQMPNADCDRLKKLGDWAVEQDNGWGDGGNP